MHYTRPLSKMHQHHHHLLLLLHPHHCFGDAEARNSSFVTDIFHLCLYWASPPVSASVMPNKLQSCCTTSCHLFWGLPLFRCHLSVYIAFHCLLWVMSAAIHSCNVTEVA